MKPKAWQAWWRINMAATIGGPFAARTELSAELRERLREGPGEAARQELAVGDSCPRPCRWTLRSLRVSVDWLSELTLSGVWRRLQSCGLTLRASYARLYSPDPEYRGKVRRLHRCLRDAVRQPRVILTMRRGPF